jgi:hypothetical protein
VPTADNSWWWAQKMPETCRLLWQNKFWIFDASCWLFYTKLVTMQGHLNIKRSSLLWDVMRRRIIVIYRISGQPIGPFFKGGDETTGRPEQSEHNYQSTPHSIADERDLKCSPNQTEVFGSVLHSLRVNSGRILQIRPRSLPFILWSGY